MTYQNTADEELLNKYFSGDKAAFSGLFNRHKDALFRYIARQCGNSAVAEELIQDVWMNLCKSPSRFKGHSKFTTYIYKIAHNRLIDYYRQSHSDQLTYYLEDYEKTLEDATLATCMQPENLAEVQFQVARLMAVLQNLPATQREVILLREESGMTLEEIAETTGVGRETVKSRLRYALKTIRTCMGDAL